MGIALSYHKTKRLRDSNWTLVVLNELEAALGRALLQSLISDSTVGRVPRSCRDANNEPPTGQAVDAHLSRPPDVVTWAATCKGRPWSGTQHLLTGMVGVGYGAVSSRCSCVAHELTTVKLVTEVMRLHGQGTLVAAQGSRGIPVGPQEWTLPWVQVKTQLSELS